MASWRKTLSNSSFSLSSIFIAHSLHLTLFIDLIWSTFLSSILHSIETGQHSSVYFSLKKEYKLFAHYWNSLHNSVSSSLYRWRCTRMVLNYPKVLNLRSSCSTNYCPSSFHLSTFLRFGEFNPFETSSRRKRGLFIFLSDYFYEQ